MTKRTARKDSNYIIYAAIHDGRAYIGLTRKGTVTVAKAVKERWRKHISRARHESQDWVIYNYIRDGAWTDWEHEVITVIRGRAEAYAYERELVKQIQPELNDQYLWRVIDRLFKGCYNIHLQRTRSEPCLNY